MRKVILIALLGFYSISGFGQIENDTISPSSSTGAFGIFTTNKTYFTAVESINELPKSELLPGIGVGVRYLMLPKERINIGFDVAVGKDDWGMYFRIGESFGQ